MEQSDTTEAVALSFLILVALVAAQNAAAGTLGPWIAGKFLNRTEAAPSPPQGSGGPISGERQRPRGTGRSIGEQIARGVKIPEAGGGPFENGRLPADQLVGIGEGGHRLTPSAAAAYRRMRAAAAADGVTLRVTDSYRSYAAQVAVKLAKPFLAATPGTSVHGWGRAIDVRSGGGRREWVQANGSRFGWIWPGWARPGGSKPEEWHFEYNG